MVIATRMPSQARAKRTRATLVSAARGEFSERGYASTTAKSIADRAGVATGTLYQYFSNKDEVLRELASEWLRQLVNCSVGLLETRPPVARSRDEVTAEAARRMRLVVQNTFEFLRGDRGLHDVFRERRKADRELDSLWSGSERTAIARIRAVLDHWNRKDDHEAMAIVLFGIVDGSVEAHLADPVVSDRRFLQALVTALIRVALPTAEAVRREGQ